MTIPKNGHFFIICFVLAILGVVLASQPNKRKTRFQDKEQQIKPIERIEDIRLTNKTTGFRVVDVKKISDKMIELTYSNDYSKSITGFEVSIGGMRAQTELILGGDVQQFIAPGDIFREQYAAQLGLDREGIQILAVVLDDGSSDGDIKYVKEIADYRLGMKTERQRVLALLEQVLKSKDQDISDEFGKLEAAISSMIPSAQQQTGLDNVGLGIRNERRRMLAEIRILKDKHQSAQVDEGDAHQLKEDLIVVKAMTENIIRLSSLSMPRRSSQ